MALHVLPVDREIEELQEATLPAVTPPSVTNCTEQSPHTDTVKPRGKAGDTLSSRHVSSCDVNACSWDVRGDLTL